MKIVNRFLVCEADFHGFELRERSHHASLDDAAKWCFENYGKFKDHEARNYFVVNVQGVLLDKSDDITEENDPRVSAMMGTGSETYVVSTGQTRFFYNFHDIMNSDDWDYFAVAVCDFRNNYKRKNHLDKLRRIEIWDEWSWIGTCIVVLDDDVVVDILEVGKVECDEYGCDEYGWANDELPKILENPTMKCDYILRHVMERTEPDMLEDDNHYEGWELDDFYDENFLGRKFADYAGGDTVYFCMNKKIPEDIADMFGMSEV